MKKIAKRLCERVGVCVLLLVLAPFVFLILVGAGLICLLPGTPLKVVYKVTNHADN